MLTQFAAAAGASGIRLSVACLADRDGNPAAEPLRAAGVEPVIVGAPPRLGVEALRAVRRHISAVQPDVVHTHLGASDFLGSIAARSLGIPAVSTLHTMVWGGSGAAGRAKANVHALARSCCGSRVIAVSESARERYVAHAVVKDDRVVTIHNGIEATPMPGAGIAVRRELGLRDDDLVVGMVSALRPEKAHDVAIAAVERLAERYPRLRLLIVGSGPSAHDVERLAAAAGETVVLAGARYDVMNVLDAVDVCLHPSRADAFPTTVLEAMAASVPVLATAVGGIREIVVDGRTGVLVPAPPRPKAVADALAALIEDPARRHELAKGGRGRYEHEFTRGPWVQRLRALYDMVIAEAR